MGGGGGGGGEGESSNTSNADILSENIAEARAIFDDFC